MLFCHCCRTISMICSILVKPWACSSAFLQNYEHVTALRMLFPAIVVALMSSILAERWAYYERVLLWTYWILVNHKPTKSLKNLCFFICFVLLPGVWYENLQNNPPPPPNPNFEMSGSAGVCREGGESVWPSQMQQQQRFIPRVWGPQSMHPTHRKEEIKLLARTKRSKLVFVGEMFGVGVVLCMFLSTLQQSYHLCIPSKGIARPQSQFPHSCAIYKFLGSVHTHIFLQQNRQTDCGNVLIAPQTHECGNWDWGCASRFLGIFVSNFLCSVIAV